MRSLAKNILFASLTLFSSQQLYAADNLIFITIDGLRWQEVFRGIDLRLATNTEYAKRGEDIIEAFWSEDSNESAKKLMPFLHNVVFEKGVFVGNRDENSCARVSNPWYFSYPGYNEILTGIVDPTINTNDPIPNKNKTFMELLSKKKDFKGQSAAFTSWDVFPAIINNQRSGIYVNVDGPENLDQPSLQLLHQIQKDTPKLWKTVRLDAFTHHYALSYLQEHKPKILYIAYGETDDFAHEGHYDQVIYSAHRTDRFIGEIWGLVNSMDNYRDNTALFITVDHGRGEQPLETWKHHASKESTQHYMKTLAHYENGIVGSEAVWMAAIGAGVSDKGKITNHSDCITSDRIASTAMAILGEDYRDYNETMGKPIEEFLD